MSKFNTDLLERRNEAGKPWRGARFVVPVSLQKKDKLKQCVDCPALIKLGRAVRCLPCQDIYKEKKDAEYRESRRMQLHG